MKIRASPVMLPEELKQLQKPWFKGRNINPKVENWIRNGATVRKSGGEYIVDRWLSGAAGTILGYEIEEGEARQFFEIRKKEYFAGNESEGAAEKAMEKLEKFLLERKVKLEARCSSHELFELTQTILSVLPEHHLGHEHFNKLILGGWNPGAYKAALCSAYQDPAVHIFTFATSGPKRNFMALLLHEIGHSFKELLSDDDKGKLLELYNSIPRLGIDYLNGEEERKADQGAGISEFTAENYLVYVTQGRRLGRFINALDPDQKSKWIELMQIYIRNFDDKIYL